MPLWPLEPPPVVHESLDERPSDLHQVHLYFADLDQEGWDGRWDEALLSSGELDRADRMQEGLRRTRFVVGRAIVRHLIGQAVNVAPSELRFQENEYGKPLLGEEWIALPSFVHFNVSHRDHALLVGLSGKGDIGLDVELLKPVVDIDRLADDHLPAARARAVKASAPERRLVEFYRAWTLEEAIAKASGLGVSGMRVARVSLSARPSPFLLVWQTEARIGGMSAIASVALATVAPDAVT